MTELRDWLSLIAIVISIAGTIWMWISAPSKKTNADLEVLRKVTAEEIKVLITSLTELARRTQALEGEMKHMPDRDMAHRLELTMEKISGRLDTLDERVKPIAATSVRLQEYLLEQAEK
ncbi:hypothetical protein C8J31_102100 [Rhizobium sp. PP-CC-2G-626]|nr:hypothetical protein C8J31_102100 [Rhizobium sp. PP-CC-2G-626]